MKKYVLLLCTMVLGMMLPSQAQQFDAQNPKDYILKGIRVVGAEYSDEQTIISLSGLSVGSSVSVPGQDISNVIKRLWKENIFSDIRVEAENITGSSLGLIITVKERPRIAQFNFQGISKSQANDLREKINFIRGTILTESKQQSAKRIIRNFYVEKGFYNTRVVITEEPDKTINNGVSVNIIVDKGPRTKIKNINIEGNTAFKAKKIKRLMKKVHEKRAWRFWARSKYVPKDFKAAKGMLIEAYNDNGFRDAIVEMDTVYKLDGKTVGVDLKVYEGQQYYFRDIVWSGNNQYDSETLSRVLKIESGEPYSTNRLNKRLSGDPQGGDVSSLYLDNGYLFYNVDPVEVTVENDSIDLEIRISEGPQATIRNILVNGNNKTSDYVILRELFTRPGQKFDRSKIIRSQREILALGFFDQENLGVNPIPDINNGTVDIEYTVEERSADQLQLQGGWGQRQRDINGNVLFGGFIGTVQLAFNNFSTKRLFRPRREWGSIVPSGDGQKLNLAIQLSGVRYKSFSLSFLEPWLGGKKPNSLGVSTSYIIIRNSTSIFGGEFYRNAIFNASIDFGKRLKFPDDFFRSFTSLGYKLYDIENPAFVFPAFSPRFNNGVEEDQALINILTLKQTFERSSVDAPIYPRSGATMTFSVEATPPYSLFRGDVDYAEMTNGEKFNLLEYHKWTFKSNWFYNVFANMVLSARLEAGFVGAYNSQLGVSPFELYHIGGSGMANFGFTFDGREIIALRGYPERYLNSTFNNDQGYPIYTRMIMELRYPLTLNQSAPVWVLGFLEGGNGYNSIKKYNPFDLYRSAGVGLRVMLPMVGLLGLDWAYGFDNPNEGDRSQFHFIIGQQF